MYSFRLTEEIARWAFETRCRYARNWQIAFTNPTAGPWKTIRCTDPYGEAGEVYRFELKETRPDIILVNDLLRLVIIFEAKDSLEKLMAGNQAEKSVEVVAQLSRVLRAKGDCPYWGRRARYPVLTGLLWGAETPTEQYRRDEVFDQYHRVMAEYGGLEQRYILGVETCRWGAGLGCSMAYRTYEEAGTDVPASVALSLGLSTLPWERHNLP